jgi:hypothetical protein
VNDTSDTITNITVAYTGEEWRNGGNTAVQKLAFSFLVSSSPITSSDAGNANIWSAVTALDFNSPVTGATAAALDGNAAANRVVIAGVVLPVAVFPGQEIFLRWFDANDAGNDHGLAVDDLTVTFTRIATVIEPPAIPTAGQPQSRTNNAGTIATFTVSATGGALSYEWRKDGNPPPADPRISGVNSQTLTLSNVTADLSGAYSVRVYNSANVNGVISSDAILTVIDPAINAQPLSRTNIYGDNANFFVGADGMPPLTYHWRFNGQDISGGPNLPSYTGPATNEGDYTVVVVNNDFVPLSVTSAPAHLTLLATPATRLTRWDFNDTNTLDASFGNGSASLVGLGNAASFAGGTFSDPAGAPGTANSGWNPTGFALQGSSNKLTGVQFNVSTVGFQDIMLVWEQRQSDTASKYTRLQYSSDGVNFVDGPVITASNNFALFSANLSGVAALNNNPNFAFRIVTEFESTAIGTTNQNYAATTTGGSYGTSGTIRFDLVTIFGNTFTGVPSRIPLQIKRDGANVILTWANPAFSLATSTDLASCTNKIPGATSPYTNPATGDRRFFRLIYP